MKRLAYILMPLLLLLACRQGDVVKKPDNLIKEDEMVDILYDMSLLQAIKTSKPQLLEQQNISAEAYIYKKYKVDSTTLVTSHKYYASQIAKYAEIQKKVSDRLKQTKEKLAPAARKDSVIEEKLPDPRAARK